MGGIGQVETVSILQAQQGGRDFLRSTAVGGHKPTPKGPVILDYCLFSRHEDELEERLRLVRQLRQVASLMVWSKPVQFAATLTKGAHIEVEDQLRHRTSEAGRLIKSVRCTWLCEPLIS